MNFKNKTFILIILILVLLPNLVLANEFTPPDRKLTRVEDDYGLLTLDQVEALKRKLDIISDKTGVDVIVHTTYSINGKSPNEYADDFFDYNGYGLGPNDDGIILVVSMEYSDISMSTHGFGIRAFTDVGQDYIWDKILNYFSQGDFYQGFDKFADLAEEFILQAQNDRPYDYDLLPKNKITPGVLGIMGAIGLGGGSIAGLSYTSMLASSHKTMSRRRTASGYQTGIVNFNNVHDRFITKNVTRQLIPRERSSSFRSSGGSSTHSSSSGRTHGGSSRKF